MNIGPEFRKLRFKSWLDLNVFFYHHPTQLMNTPFNSVRSSHLVMSCTMEMCMVSSLGLTVTLDLITDNIMHGPVYLTRH